MLDELTEKLSAFPEEWSQERCEVEIMALLAITHHKVEMVTGIPSYRVRERLVIMQLEALQTP